VINDHAAVSPDVRARVLEVIERTGYTPNMAARSLVSGKSGVIGLVIPSRVHSLFEDPYFSRLIAGITSAANEAGTTLSLFLFQNEEEEAALYPRVVSSRFLDGLIITATRKADPLVARINTDEVPVVMVGRPDVAGLSYVDADNKGGAHQAALHLADLGHRRIGLIAAPGNTTAGQDRTDGFIEGLATRGRALHPSLRADGDFSAASGYAAMQQLIPNEPDAVFVASDTMAVGALRALRERGIRVPEDVALMGFDGLAPSNATTPRLTTMHQPVTETGRRAVRVLDGLVNGTLVGPVSEVLPVDLVVRESCGTSIRTISEAPA
jgi:LacI family transcriptional regulator